MTQVLTKTSAEGYTSDALVVEFDAEKAATGLATLVFEHLKKSLLSGNSASGGRLMPLDPRGGSGRDAQAGNRPSIRGVTKIRKFPRSFGIRKGRGGRSRATSAVLVGSRFGHWLTKERDKRGVDYFPLTGDVEKVIDDELKWIVKQIVK